MQDKIFLDTNILIYGYSQDEPIKKEIATNLLFSKALTIISTQVINELINVFFKKFQLDSTAISMVLQELESYLQVVNFSTTTQKRAIDIKRRYKLQYFDALIVATAIEKGCEILYSEDMQHNQIIDEKLMIINPFIKA